MTSQGLFQSLPLCQLILQMAALLAPRQNRADWIAEWKAELWHVWSACRAAESTVMSGNVVVNPVKFCFGAFQDALWLRRNQQARAPLRLLRHGSPSTCLLSLAVAVVAALLLGLCMAGVRNAVLPMPYADSDSLVTISPSGTSISQQPSVRLADYRLMQTASHTLFTEVAYYQPILKRVHIAPHQTSEMSIIRSSASLFDLLRLPSFASPRDAQPMPELVLSETAWQDSFDSDPNIAGRVVSIAGHQVRIAGVLPQGLWRLPGRADGWMIADQQQMDSLAPNAKGFALARMATIASPSGMHWVTVFHADGDAARFECVSLAAQARQPFSMFLFTLLIACLALPATTPLPLGEYPARAERLDWRIRVRRWLFFGAKLGLVLPLIFFVSLDLSYSDVPRDVAAHLLHTSTPLSSQYLQLSSSFFGLLFAFRWALQDQRSRCPVCLRRLTSPARVGEASRNFLAWNGTELICSGGHGLLHVPEIPTSWFSTQRWLYLDSSWSGLFSDSYVAPAGIL